MGRATSDYDDYADAYAAYGNQREQGGVEGDPFGILPHLLDLLGDLDGTVVLDAGCGDGYLARLLHERGGRVTGIDLSPQLIARAEERNQDGAIVYRAADLSAPLPDYAGKFDLIASYLVLNNVANYRGFAATLGQVWLRVADSSSPSTTPMARSSASMSATTSPPTRSLLIAASGRPESRSTTITARWRNI